VESRPTHIERLPDALIDQIAAGEVVERPASVLRELLDNAIDAAASRIDVEVRAGGVERLAVRDDGHGIPAEQVPLALQRHATSKIRRIEDLEGVGTLGFRGEALPSIASVSRFRLTSRPADALAGVQVEVVGGTAGKAREVGAPVGTRVEVEDLFFNVPARRKFLRTRRTESARLFDVLNRLALARPDVHLVLTGDGREQLNLPPSTGLRGRLAAVFGRTNADRLASLDRRGSLVRVHGFLSPPDLSRSTSAGLHLFVNGRSIRDRGLLGALRGGYRGLLEPGRFPLGVLFLEMNPALVDVNVHPQKAEVRFREATGVRGSLVAAVREFLAAAPWLGAGGGRWELGALAGRPSGEGAPVSAAAEQGRARGGGYLESAERFRSALRRFGGTAREAPAHAEGSSQAELTWVPGPGGHPLSGPSGLSWGRGHDGAAGGERERGGGQVGPAQPPPGGPAADRQDGFFATLRLLGQIGGTYLVCAAPSGLVVIDQHAAHERVTFERLKTAHGKGKVPSQAYLIPERIELPPRERLALEGHLALLADLGFELEPFGGGSFLLKALPAALVGAEPQALLAELVEALASHAAASARGAAAGALEARLEAAWATMACHASVRAGQMLSEQEQRALLVALDGVGFRGNCPHGRPVATEIGLAELEQRMKRR